MSLKFGIDNAPMATRIIPLKIINPYIPISYQEIYTGKERIKEGNETTIVWA